MSQDYMSPLTCIFLHSYVYVWQWILSDWIIPLPSANNEVMLLDARQMQQQPSITCKAFFIHPFDPSISKYFWPNHLPYSCGI